MKKIFAMLPCYNEQEDIESLVEKWIEIKREWENKGYELFVYCIDDKSTDNTNEIIKGMIEKYPDTVNIIEHDQNKGLGGAIFTAFTFFNNNGQDGDLLVIMDGDNTHDPCYSLSMPQKIADEEFCVIASRYCNNSQTKGVSGIRLFMSWGARFFYSITLSVPNVKDYTCGYRLYTYSAIKSAIECYGDSFIERQTFACMMEALYKLSLIGVKFDEVPFELRYDNKLGESKMPIVRTIIESVGTAISLRINKKHFKKNMK